MSGSSGADMTSAYEAWGLNAARKNAYRKCILATYNEDNKPDVRHRMGTRPGALVDMGIPGDVVDPPYALAIYDPETRQWRFDENCEPDLKLAICEWMDANRDSLDKSTFWR